MGKKLAMGEFVALIALLFALTALSIDMMLPALGVIGRDLGLSNANYAQLVLSSFMLGIGLGQLVMGPLSDAYGRKVILGVGIFIFIIACFWASLSSDFIGLLLSRFVQGLGISAPRSVAIALVRDVYKGREMAKVISVAMMIFMIVPATAPLFGQIIMIPFGWRAIFIAMIVIAVICYAWLMIRQKETHPPHARRAFTWGLLIDGGMQILRNRRVVISIITLTLTFSMLLAYLISAQQIFVDWLQTGERFPIYFALIALISAMASFSNSLLVMRFGMWMISCLSLGMIMVISLLASFLFWQDLIIESYKLVIFIIWSCGFFFLNAHCLANLNALALEPMGHIAGLASALIGCFSTTFCIGFAGLIGQMYDGSGLPLIFGIAIISVFAFAIHFINPRTIDHCET